MGGKLWGSEGSKQVKCCGWPRGMQMSQPGRVSYIRDGKVFLLRRQASLTSKLEFAILGLNVM